MDVLLVAGGERWSINQNFSYQKSFAKRKDQYGAAVKADDMGPLILPFSGVLFCMQLKKSMQTSQTSDLTLLSDHLL